MYQKILLTLDGSPLARAAIGHAKTLAEGTDCAVTVLQVVESLDMTRLAMIPEAYESGRSLEEVAKGVHFARKSAAEGEVQRAAEILRNAGVEQVQPIVREGLPANVILDTATSEDANAIVMATRGHSGLGREVTGSVAEFVLRHAGPLAVVLVGPRTADPATGQWT